MVFCGWVAFFLSLNSQKTLRLLHGRLLLVFLAMLGYNVPIVSSAVVWWGFGGFLVVFFFFSCKITVCFSSLGA